MAIHDISHSTKPTGVSAESKLLIATRLEKL